MADLFDSLAGELPDDRQRDNFGAFLRRIGTAATEDELFVRLAEQRPPQSRLARQQLRGRLVKLLKEKLPALDSGASPAKTADAWLQEGGDECELQGREFTAEEIEPWPTQVDGAHALDMAHGVFDEYVFAPSEYLDALALWVTLTHIFDVSGTCPILDLSSPTMRCGKTSTALVARQLVRNPLVAANITPAALFRVIEAWQPTLIVDEADSFAALDDELRGLFNSGHTRDTAFVLRVEGDSREPRAFSTWAPKMIAAIGRLPTTIEDRSIRVPLMRKPTGVAKGDAFDSDALRALCRPIARRLVRFTLDSLDAIASATPSRPAGLNDRAFNNWRPLFAIADVAGPDWLQRAVRAAQILTDGEAVDEDEGTLAVRHVSEIVGPGRRVATEDVLAELVRRDDGPWARKWEAKLAKGETKGPSAQLARLLRPFGINPRQLWIDEENKRGYDADWFDSDAVAPYLEAAPSLARDARDESRRHAGSSVPNDPSVKPEASRGDIPVLGDEPYPVLLANATRDGYITRAEAGLAYAVHQAVVHGAEAVS
jgi:putative DNA primase/helicase